MQSSRISRDLQQSRAPTDPGQIQINPGSILKLPRIEFQQGKRGRITGNRQEEKVKQKPDRVAALGEKQNYSQLQQALPAWIFAEIQGDDEGGFHERRREEA